MKRLRFLLYIYLKQVRLLHSMSDRPVLLPWSPSRLQDCILRNLPHTADDNNKSLLRVHQDLLPLSQLPLRSLNVPTELFLYLHYSKWLKRLRFLLYIYLKQVRLLHSMSDRPVLLPWSPSRLQDCILRNLTHTADDNNKSLLRVHQDLLPLSQLPLRSLNVPTELFLYLHYSKWLKRLRFLLYIYLKQVRLLHSMSDRPVLLPWSPSRLQDCILRNLPHTADDNNKSLLRVHQDLLPLSQLPLRSLNVPTELFLYLHYSKWLKRLRFLLYIYLKQVRLLHSMSDRPVLLPWSPSRLQDCILRNLPHTADDNNKSLFRVHQDLLPPSQLPLRSLNVPTELFLYLHYSK